MTKSSVVAAVERPQVALEAQWFIAVSAPTRAALDIALW